MLKETYVYVDMEDKTEYYFYSEGLQGKIMKKVVFIHIRENLWNLGFGDWRNGEIDDSVISNNHDIIKLIGTIAKIAYEFSAEFPTRDIYIEPVDEKRKQLYNFVFRRNYKAINQIFHVTGTFNNTDEDYSPKNYYDTFILKRKFVQ